MTHVSVLISGSAAARHLIKQSLDPNEVTSYVSHFINAQRSEKVTMAVFETDSGGIGPVCLLIQTTEHTRVNDSVGQTTLAMKVDNLMVSETLRDVETVVSVLPASHPH